MVRNIEKESKKILNRYDNTPEFMMLPFRLTATLYEGCLHSCSYCPAGVRHLYDDSDKEIEVKINAPQVLSKELSQQHRKELIMFCQDPYHSLEKKYEITRKSLEVLRDYKWPCLLETKSNLILRDLDIIREIDNGSFCSVGTSIATLNQELVSLLEPYSDPPMKRLEFIKKFSDEGIETYIHIMPFIPLITDLELDEIVKLSADAGVNYTIMDFLFITPTFWNFFKNVLEERNPHLVDEYEKLYFLGEKDKYSFYPVSKEYQERVKDKISEVHKKHGMALIVPGHPDISNANFGVKENKWRYPAIHDFWNFMRERDGENVNLEQIIELVDQFDVVDDSYKVAIKDFWEDGTLFQELDDIERVSLNDEIFYRYKTKSN